MRKFLFGIALAFVFNAQAQTCCTNPTAAFAKMGANKSFQADHDNPLPFLFLPENGADITLKAADGTDVFGYEIKSKQPSNKYVFVIQEWWGLNEHIKQNAEDLYKVLPDVNVIALDMYDKKVATTREEAGKFMSEAKKERLEVIVNSFIDYTPADAQIYTIGWCFGGGWSLQTSIMAGKKAAGCIIYYGMPEKNVDRLKTLNCDVLGIFANKEKWISPAVVNQFETDMKTAGKKLTLKRYDAEHAFANPSNPQYDKVATEDAHKAVLDFYLSKMKPATSKMKKKKK
jgi:carboxymethylenebutenolidase